MLVNGKTHEGRTVMVLADWQANSASSSHRDGRRKGKKIYKRIARRAEQRAWRSQAREEQ